MKKIYKATVILLLIFGAFPLIQSDQTNVYLDNYYGAPIGCIIGEKAEFIVPNGTRTDSLGDINSLSSITIKTTGFGSTYGLSPQYPLANTLATIKDERINHINSDAIIAVLPSNFYNAWNIEIRWEPRGVKVETFAKRSFLTREGERAKAVLGEEYAKKVHAIASTDYKKAEGQGMVNLWKELKRSFEPPTYTKMKTKIPGSPQPNLQQTEDEIKLTIDRLSRSLQRYKERGFVV